MKGKRILSLLLTLVMVMGLLPTTVWAAKVGHTVSGGSIKFDKDTRTITGFDGDPTQVTIPEEIDGVAVEHIGNNAFESCITLTSVTIPDSVTSLGNEAFLKCINLTSVTIGNGVTKIGAGSFQECVKLKSVTIPDSVTSLGNLAFFKCTNLSSVTLGNSVTKIGGNTFAHCSSLTSVIIPNIVTSIQERAFYECNNLKSVIIPDSVTIIGSEAFEDCSSLTKVTIGKNVTTIGKFAFNRCHKLESLMIGNSVTSIGEHAFGECALTSLTIPNSVTEIGQGAFSGNEFTSVTIPDSVTDLSGAVFANCRKLTSVKIGNGVTKIGFNTFLGCTSLKSVIIPNNVTSIGIQAFEDCSSLTKVTIPDSVTTIEREAFSSCNSLTSVTIPDSVTTIEREAFSSCNELTNVTIGKRVTRIEECVFDGCSSLTSIDVASGNSSYSSTDGVLFDKEKTELIWYPTGKTESFYTIPNSVQTIVMRAFKDCTSLKSVIIPNSVTRIEGYAFGGCSNLEHVIYLGGQNGWAKLINNIQYNTELLDAELHLIYFTLQPQGGTILSDKSHTVTWETNFEPVFLKRYKDGVEDKGIADYSDPTITSEIISEPGVYYYQAFYDIGGVAHAINSDEFMIKAPCSVIFDPTGGSVTPTSAITGDNGKLTSLPTPTRDGYVFVGWFTEKSGGEKISLDREYSSNTTIYAQWTPILSGSLSYNISDTCYVGQEIMSYRDEELNPVYYSVPDGAFHYQWEISDNGSKGWTEITGATTDSYTPVDSDAEKYIRLYVTVDGYISSVYGNIVKVSSPEKSDNYDIPAAPILTAESPYTTVTITNAKASQEYVFNYTGIPPTDWSGAQSPSADGTLILNVKSGELIRVYTRYKETETTNAGKEIRFSYIPAYDYVELQVMDFDKNELIVVQPGTYELNFVPIPDSFEWGARTVKWTFDNNYVQLFKDSYGSQPISSGDSVKGLTKVYVKGVEQTPETIITASAQVGANVYTAYCNAEVSDNMQRFTLRHLDFGGEMIEDPGTNSATSFMIIPARAQIGTVTFEKISGPASTLDLEVMSIKDTSGTLNVQVPADAEKGTYVYSVKVDGEETYEPSILSITVLSDKATVTFDANGGSGEMKSETVYLGKLYILPKCGFTAPAGMEFDGWDIGKPGDHITLGEDIKLTAQWKLPVAYTVTFKDGDSVLSKQTVSEGKKTTKPADPTKDGYIFKGWYQDSAYTEIFDFNQTITSNTTVYAKFELITVTGFSLVTPGKTAYTVGEALDVSGMEIKVDYSDGTSVTIPVTAEMVSGFNSYAPNANLTLTILYEHMTTTYDVSISETAPVTYDITVKVGANGTASASATSATAGTTITINATPDSGYKIEKITWKPEDGTETDITSTGKLTMPEAKVTVNVSFTESRNIYVKEVQLKEGYYFSHDDGTETGIGYSSHMVQKLTITEVVNGVETDRTLTFDEIGKNINYNGKTPENTYDQNNMTFKYNIPVYFGNKPLTYKDGKAVNATAYIGVKGDANLDNRLTVVDATYTFKYVKSLNDPAMRTDPDAPYKFRLNTRVDEGTDSDLEELSAFLSDVNCNEYDINNWTVTKLNRKFSTVDASMILGFQIRFGKAKGTQETVSAKEIWDIWGEATSYSNRDSAHKPNKQA